MARHAAHASNNLIAEVRAKTARAPRARPSRRQGAPVLYGHGADPQPPDAARTEFSAGCATSAPNAVLTLDSQQGSACAAKASRSPDPAHDHARRPDHRRRGER